MGACARNMESDPAEIKPTQCCIKLMLPATITHVPVAAVLVLNTPDDGRLRPKHVKWPCRNKTYTVLHQVSVSFDLYYDARKHKIKTSYKGLHEGDTFVSPLPKSSPEMWSRITDDNASVARSILARSGQKDDNLSIGLSVAWNVRVVSRVLGSQERFRDWTLISICLINKFQSSFL